MGVKTPAVHGSKGTWVRLFETEKGVEFEDTVFAHTEMTPTQTRELASQLYRLARRVEKRKGTTT